MIRSQKISDRDEDQDQDDLKGSPFECIEINVNVPHTTEL